jgi:cytochrome c oxidase subunit 3
LGSTDFYRHNVYVTSATHAPSTPAHPTLNRPNMVSVGTVVWLSSELMFFAGLIAMYVTLRSTS